VTGLLDAVAIALLAMFAIAMAVHCARQARHRARYTEAELNDFRRGDIDPDWPQLRGTMPGCQEGRQK
jgi:hypothetical protein